MKKILITLLIFTLTFTQTGLIFAEEVPTAPQPPSTPILEVSTPQPPTAPESPSYTDESKIDETVEEENDEIEEENKDNVETSEVLAEEKTGIVENGNVGDTEITTGDAINSLNSTTDINTNIESTGDGTSDLSVDNSQNGSGSDNSVSVETNSENSTEQNNSAKVGNEISGASITGDNSASLNVGDSSITTGNANITSTTITAANTNISGVSVSEFNVNGDQNGDIILDFSANCISGCGGNPITLANSNNGSNSDNSITIEDSTTNSTEQNNNAEVENDIILAANSGDNSTSKNTNGNSNITTGDANIDANVVTLLNNNINGEVLIGVVNIFGNLIGDIILPQSILNNAITQITNSGNGVNSSNVINVDSSTSDLSFQNNDATIENNLILFANTGDNKTNYNTGGNSSVLTGNASVDVNLFNIANNNIGGGVWWLVLVNKAGQWFGQIIGGQDGQILAGSEGTVFATDGLGQTTISNSGNGVNSTNEINFDQVTNNTTTQNNNAHIVNNLNLNANTGGNTASYNTGGNSTIQTGDAKIIANLINFINNNIKGKLVVTVVNVFGNWFGDFLPPGVTKPKNESVLNPSTNNASGSKVSESNSSGSSSSSIEENSEELNRQELNENKENNSLITYLFRQEEPGNGITLVAGESKKNDNLLTKDVIYKPKVTKINLAWMLTLLPLPLLFVFLKNYKKGKKIV